MKKLNEIELSAVVDTQVYARRITQYAHAHAHIRTPFYYGNIIEPENNQKQACEKRAWKKLERQEEKASGERYGNKHFSSSTRNESTIDVWYKSSEIDGNYYWRKKVRACVWTQSALYTLHKI